MIYSVVKKSLIIGNKMICPRCKEQQDVLSYTRLDEIEEFNLETAPIYKCSKCRWLFCPTGELPQEIYAKLYEAIQVLLGELQKHKES